MFGLTIEKIIVIGVVAAIIIGPQRLPLYAEKLATFIRNFRSFTDSTRRRAEEELGVPVAAMDPKTWNTQFRAYDPRRIVRDALNGDGTAGPATAPDAAPDAVASSPETGREPEPEPAQQQQQEPVQEYRERWVVVGGSSGHPIRRRIVEPVPPVSDVQDDEQDVQDDAQDAPAAAAAPAPAAP